MPGGGRLFRSEPPGACDEETLRQLQASINKGWKDLFAKYDLYHFIQLWGKLSNADKKGPLFGAFIGATSDALLSMAAGEKQRVLAHAEEMGLLWETTGCRLSRRYWKAHAKYHVAAPAVLLERLHAVYLFFRGCRDEHNRPFFVTGHEV